MNSSRLFNARFLSEQTNFGICLDSCPFQSRCHFINKRRCYILGTRCSFIHGKKVKRIAEHSEYNTFNKPKPKEKYRKVPCASRDYYYSLLLWTHGSSFPVSTVQLKARKITQSVSVDYTNTDPYTRSITFKSTMVWSQMNNYKTQHWTQVRRWSYKEVRGLLLYFWTGRVLK